MKFGRQIIPLFLLILISCDRSSCLMEWLFGTGDEETAERGTSSDEEEGTIRFEVLSSDEKFLDFAQTLNELSPLDACYNIVIYNLRKRCGELTEEELGKLSVQLLNCQSEAEDRPVFLCTSSMSLADCTKTMDGTTWNSYQIVGNRARAMCYATQQVQFRRLTEMSVNKLVSVTSEQIDSLKQIKASQAALHALTSDTVDYLQAGQRDLLTSQAKLKEGHQDLLNHVSGNMKDILQEKALIATGNQELAAMTEDIRHRLEATSRQIQEREEVEHLKHERILADLRDIQHTTEASISKLDTKLQRLLSQLAALEGQFSVLGGHMTKMNVSLSRLMLTLTFMQDHLDTQISWITQLLGGADNKLSAMSCCLLHIAYFFLVAVVATYLQMALTSRLTFLAIIVGNVAADLNYNQSLDFAGLTVFLFTVYFGAKLTIYLGEKFGPTRFGPSMPGGHADGGGDGGVGGLTKEDINTLVHLLHKVSHSLGSFPHPAPPSPVGNGTVLHDITPPTPPSGARLARADFNNSAMDGMHRDVIAATGRVLGALSRDQGSRSSSRASTPVPRDSRSSTPSVSSRCLSRTNAGNQCRLPAAGGSDYCRIHNTPR